MSIRRIARRGIKALSLMGALVVAAAVFYDAYCLAGVRAKIDAALADASLSERHPSENVAAAFGVNRARAFSISRSVARVEYWRELFAGDEPPRRDFVAHLVAVVIWPPLLSAHYSDEEFVTLIIYRHGLSVGWQRGPGALSLEVMGKDLNDLSDDELACLAVYLRVRPAKGHDCSALRERLSAAVKAERPN